MKNWSVRRRVLLIALLPAALLAVALSTCNAYQQIHAAERQAIEHARAVAVEIGPIAAHAVMAADDDALLERLTKTLITGRTAIAGITIRDRADNVLLDMRRGDSPASDAGGDAARITHPIRNVASANSPAVAAHAPRSPGSIEIAVDLARARSERIVPLLEGLTLTALVLGLTALVAVRIGRSLTDPVCELVRGIDRIRAGEYGYRPHAASGGELGQLERGVQELASDIEGTQRSLHDRIEEATRELQTALDKLEQRNAELESARREAEAASAFKSRFLANISHEIRTPMNSILGFTELLERADLNPVYADYLVTIQSSAQSLLDLLNGILDLSKIESGHMALEYADTDINELLYTTFNLLAPQAFAKGVEFVVQPAPERDSAVRVDAVRLNQVLINLASNAVKFTDEGWVRISAHAAARGNGGVALTFSVVDTGRGIPHAAQACLFQAFAQGEDIRGDERRQAVGTGLGLHIASETVFLMDGLIEFRSEPGTGSEFWFTLELEHAHAALGHGGSPPRRRVLLVIDGDPDFITAHVAMLSAAGIDAAPIATHRPASEWTDMTAVDAILVHIPAREVHEGKTPSAGSIPAGSAPICAYVYAEGPEIHQRLLDKGFARVVPKTPDPGALRSSLERALHRPGHDEALSAWQPYADGRPASGAARKALVVDDQPVNLKLLESFLEGTGWETVAATGSDEALYHARRTRFHAILMDIHLPERDGIETSAIMRRPGEPNAHTPILAITADALAEQTHAAMAAGMNGVLVKPVSQTTLLECLAQWCHPGESDADTSESGESAGTRSAAPPIYCPEDARTRAGGRPGVADELFAMLSRHLPSSRAELRWARDQSDPQALLTAAHRLKGAAAYCGVPRLRHDLTVLEECVRNGDDPASAIDAVCNTIDTLLQMDSSDALDSHISSA